jgi:hypothetical protein
VSFKNLDKLRPRRPKTNRFFGETVVLPTQVIEPGAASLQLTLALPEGYKLNPQAPATTLISSAQAAVLTVNHTAQQTIHNSKFPLTIPIESSEGKTEVEIELTVYYCESAKESLCFFKEIRIQLPVCVTKGAGKTNLLIHLC